MSELKIVKGAPRRDSIIYSSAEIASMPPEPVHFHIEPYIPTQGVVLLYGKYGTYKTPLTMNMAKAIATGGQLAGLEINQASPVLYVEMDTPPNGALQRLHSIGLDDVGPGLLDFALCYPGFDVVNPACNPLNMSIYGELARVHAERQYKVVFVDTLRTIHTLEDSSSEAPPQVYRAMATLFPGAVVVAIHHDKKTRYEPDMGGSQRLEMEAESFSGSQAWINHATVAVKLVHRNKRKREIALMHTKSQVSELQHPLLMRVNSDSALFTDASEVSELQFSKAFDSLDSTLLATAKDLAIAEIFGFSARTARRHRKELEAKRFGQSALANGQPSASLIDS